MQFKSSQARGFQSSAESSNYVDLFLERHGLRRTPIVEAESKAIFWTMAANILVNQGYRRLFDHEFTKTPAVCFVLQLLHRSFEHTDAAIVAFTTGSPGSSEGLSRMAFESSISIRYVLADQPESRLLAYFQHYKNEEERRLRKWREATQKLSEAAKREQAEAIALRTRGVEALSNIIDRLENE